MAALAADVLGGIAYSFAEHINILEGLYWAIVTAATVGYGDITPKTLAGHIIAVCVILTALPLVGAAFSMLASEFTNLHVKNSEARIKAHLEDKLEEHHNQIKEHIDQRMG